MAELESVDRVGGLSRQCHLDAVLISVSLRTKTDLTYFSSHDIYISGGLPDTWGNKPYKQHLSSAITCMPNVNKFLRDTGPTPDS